MSYKLNDLYEAIALSGREINTFKVSNEREYGSGSVYFTSRVGSVRQVYASPHWEIENFEFVVDTPLEVRVAVQLEIFNEETGEHENSDFAELTGLVLTGNLEQDLESYFNLMEGYLNSLQ